MKRADRSNEFDIRAAVVRQLLADGLERRQIRIEIPLDTASHTGRGDIVVLTSRITCIELKSGKDIYCAKAIKEQCTQYNRSFDAVGTVIDLSHKREWEEKIEHWPGAAPRTYTRDNWHDVDIQYCHATRQLQDRWGTPVNHFFSNYENRFRSYKTCVYDMASILWADEARAISGMKTKSSYTAWVRENACLKDVRPKVIDALLNRCLNQWEAKFWAKFDALEPIS